MQNRQRTHQRWQSYSSKAVNVKNAGSPMGTATIIEVGSDPETKKRQAILNKSVGERSKSISQMRQGYLKILR